MSCQDPCNPCNPCPETENQHYDNCGCINPTTFECITQPGEYVGVGITNSMNGKEVLNSLVQSILGLSNDADDKFAKISATDTTSGYLFNKIKKSGEGVNLIKRNTGFNEYLEISLSTELLATIGINKSVRNGLSETTANIFELGGVLLNDTTLSGNKNLAINQGSLTIGTLIPDGKITVSTNNGKAARIELLGEIDNISDMIGVQSQVLLVGGPSTRTSQKHLAGLHSSLVLIPSGNQTWNEGIIAGSFSELALSVNGTNPIVTANVASNTATIIITDNATYSEISAYKAAFPTSAIYQPGRTLFTGIISNYIGVKIEPSDVHGNLINRITNKYGIYQEGINDKNIFAGPIESSSTGYWKLPVGTTSQRPAAPKKGAMRFNNTTDKFEGYTGTGWVDLN